MGQLFHLVLTQPLFNLLVFLYKYVTFEDLGLAIIALTIVVRFVLYPIFYKGLRSQAVMQRIQPDIAKIQREHKDDKQKQAQAMMDVYRQNKVNPFSSMFYLFAQLPILIAVYRIFYTGLTTEAFANLYSFVTPPETVNHIFLGLIDITQPNFFIVILAAIAQYFQSKLAMSTQASKSPANPMQRYLVYLGPVLTLLILPSLSAAIGLYWTTSAVFSIFQQYLINKKLHVQHASGQN